MSCCSSSLIPRTRDGINHRPFAYPQNDSTTEKYQVWGLQLLCFVLRWVSSTGEPVLPVLLTDNQVKHSKAILAALDAPHPLPDPAFDTLIHAFFDSLFFSQHKQVSRHQTQCPVQSFIMCSAIHPVTGNFERCGSIVSRLSALLHVLRLVAVKSIADKAEDLDDMVENPEFEYEVF